MARRKPRTIRWAACLWLVAAISGCDRSPDQLLAVDGKSVDISGKVLLVNYWAEWCKPCREEIPELNQVVRGRDDLMVVGINYDQLPAERTAEQAKKMGIEFPVLIAEPAGRWGQEKPEVLPTTFIVGADGRWLRTLVGPQTVESLEAAVK
ncbi:TlpA family protein disulfide reductase [Microbulbifer taiwanensis]|uniref:TlpA family protein disulfide reductase n=1 Tax=Microbulbifer taiwanensis TaxID=986746 RepID=UPI0018687CC4